MKRLFIICGSPGSGKSTYAGHLASELHATLLDVDVCSEKLVKVALGESGRDMDDRDSEYFKSTYRDVIYDTLFSIARENLAHTDVIIVGPFTRELRDPDWPYELKSTFQAEVLIHYLFCNPEIRRDRLIRRGERRDLSKLNAWNKSQAYYGNEEPPAFEHVYIDTGAKKS